MNRKLALAGAVAVAAVVSIALGTASNAAGFTPLGAASVKAAVTQPFTAGYQPDGSQVQCWDIRTGSATLHAEFGPNGGVTTCPTGYYQHIAPAPVAGPKGDTGATGAAGATGATGPAGPAGPAGTSAVLTANASTALSARTDSGTHGDWATDAYTRNASITRQHAAPVAKCGAGATDCWFYTGSVTDSGSFLTITGANSPENGTVIAGTHVAGTFTGGSSFEFYASSGTPNASLVPATLTGNGQSTSTWMRQFFAAGTQFAGEDEPKWSWSYAAPSTCETWVNGSAGDTGDVQGINHC